MRTPSATYRLQLNGQLTFRQAAGIVDYLHRLGVSDVYSSPFLMARTGSTHGYDVVDHSRLNPEIGDEEEFREFSDRLRDHRMGLIADVVPNHMCIIDCENRWWRDVLENGPSSLYARYFDIDWNPPKEELVNKVLLPMLGDQFGRVLENQELRIAYDSGAFQISFYDKRLPLAPRSWMTILEHARTEMVLELGEQHEDLLEFESIITALNHLPLRTETDESKTRERQREKQIIKKRLSTLYDRNPAIQRAITTVLTRFNGVKGDPRSFDQLELLLEDQAYRLSYWRVAADEINYRRFFDINELAAIHVEDPEVFAAVHALLFRFVSEGRITGLRIDHPDGLFAPEDYFRDLQAECCKLSGEDRFYVVAEKIVMRDELMRTTWPIEGTSGYDYLHTLNSIFVDRTRERAMLQLYRRFTGSVDSFDTVVYDSKRLILQVAMSSELNVLSRRLDRISEQHRWSRDFTLENLRDALREVLTCFPVYRTYTALECSDVHPEDRRHISSAVRQAKRRNPAINASVFDFIESLLLCEKTDGLTDAQAAERRMFTMRFQQLTGPVMAKGVEDTAFYRHFPLASLNEVGGGPEHFGESVNYFHRKNVVRRTAWPNSMLATSTHDTKRGEDVRARINVLSEMPAQWAAAVMRWRQMNQGLKTKLKIIGDSPSANEEYLIYQTIVGTWPFKPMEPDEFERYTTRLEHYMQKAVHEAKVNSSWISPNVEYDEAVMRFVRNALDPSASGRFLSDLVSFAAPVVRAGMWNSLAQVVLKIASPGVPDIYQGSDLWNFSLVDPDNRQPIDFEVRRQLLERLRNQGSGGAEALVRRLVADPSDGAIKLWVTQRSLCRRRSDSDLFLNGDYVPLMVTGQQAGRVIAFARVLSDRVAIALAGRFFWRDAVSGREPVGDAAWGDTAILLPRTIAQRSFRDAFTNQFVAAEKQQGRTVLRASAAFGALPVALLASE